MDNGNNVDATITSLIDAFKSDDENRAFTEVMVLVGGALIDLRRIADAVSKLSTFEVTKIGELLHIGPDFTPEQVELLRALERGDIKVVPVIKDPNTDPRFDGEYPWLGIDGQPPIEPYDRVEVWAPAAPGEDTPNIWRGPAAEVEWVGGKWSFWRRSPAWIDWEGSNANGPAVPANTLVDVRHRHNSRGSRIPDRLGVSPVDVQWLNTGRPTNADVVEWRISAIQADPAVAEVYGADLPGVVSFDDPSQAPEYNGEWIEYRPGAFKPSNPPYAELPPGYAYPAPIMVDLLHRNENVTKNVDPNMYDWEWYPVLGGNPGNAPTDILAWRPAQ